MPAPPEESEPAMVRAIAVMAGTIGAIGEPRKSRRDQPMVASPGNISSIQPEM